MCFIVKSTHNNQHLYRYLPQKCQSVGDQQVTEWNTKAILSTIHKISVDTGGIDLGGACGSMLVYNYTVDGV